MKNYEICDQTGLPKSVEIEYFLEGKSLGKTLTSQMSFNGVRIRDAKSIGIDYYDRFVLDGDKDSETVKMLYNGILEPFNDFKTPDECINKSFIGV